MKVYFYLFLLSILLFWKCESSESKKDQLELTFDSLINIQKNSWNLPGLALGIIKNGEVVYAKGFGVQGIDTNVPLTTKSVFHMASVSKTFVATAIMQLVEAGKVDLDKRLADYLPYFRMADDRYQRITIRQILNHSSGIPDVEDYEWSNPQYDDLAAERYARSFVNTSLDFTPGTQYSYSNAAFDLLANVISMVSGMTFEEYMKKNIFKPIGMVNSTFIKNEVPDGIATKPHILGDSLQIVVSKIYPYNRMHAPSSTLQSNVEDMLKWAKVYLNKGEINNKIIFSESSYNLLTRSQFKAERTDSVCLGWFVRHVGNYRVNNHSGGDDGYLTFFAFIPQINAALVMMANNDFYWSGDASRILLQQLLLNKVNKEWQLPITYKLKDYILTEGIEKCKEVYYYEKTHNPDKYVFKGWCLDELGYQLLDRGFHEQALEVFQFNWSLDSNNASWTKSIADAYLAMTDTLTATEWYNKAIELDSGQEYSRAKIKELGARDL